jgi:hypothetical protein
LTAALPKLGLLLDQYGIARDAPERWLVLAYALAREHGELHLDRSFATHGDEARMQALAKKATRELEELLAEDTAEQEKGS